MLIKLKVQSLRLKGVMQVVKRLNHMFLYGLKLIDR